MPWVSFRDLNLLNLATCLSDQVFLFFSDMRPHAEFFFLSAARVEVLWNPHLVVNHQNHWKALSYLGSTLGSIDLTDISRSVEIVMDLP